MPFATYWVAVPFVLIQVFMIALVIGLAATPRPLTNTSSLRSAARTSSKRPIAHMRLRGSQTAGPAARIVAKIAVESSSALRE